MPRQNTEQIKAYYQPFIDALRAAGATLVDVTFTPDYSQIGDDRTSVLQYEFKTDLNKYLAGRGAKYKTLEDLIKFNEENKETRVAKIWTGAFYRIAEEGRSHG